jgi:DNA uptake protein ComE-like DNA-binding protein
VLTVVLLPASFAACTQPRNTDDLREKTAQATANAKRDAKAIAQGIREGWSRDKPLDLNSATKEQLLMLPGISPAEADRMMEGRPYHESKELLDRQILSKSQYDQIADRVTAKK